MLESLYSSCRIFYTLALAGLGPAHHTGVNSSHGDAAFVEASKLYARRKEAHLSGVTVQPRGALDVDTASDKSALTVTVPADASSSSSWYTSASSGHASVSAGAPVGVTGSLSVQAARPVSPSARRNRHGGLGTEVKGWATSSPAPSTPVMTGMIAQGGSSATFDSNLRSRDSGHARDGSEPFKSQVQQSLEASGAHWYASSNSNNDPLDHAAAIKLLEHALQCASPDFSSSSLPPVRSPSSRRSPKSMSIGSSRVFPGMVPDGAPAKLSVSVSPS